MSIASDGLQVSEIDPLTFRQVMEGMALCAAYAFDPSVKLPEGMTCNLQYTTIDGKRRIFACEAVIDFPDSIK